MSCTFTITLETGMEFIHWIDREPYENDARWAFRCESMAEDLSSWFMPSIWGEAEPFKVVFG